MINYDRFLNIIDLLNLKNENESDLNKNLYQTISNDTKIETEIYNTVENIRNELYDYQYYEEKFKEDWFWDI